MPPQHATATSQRATLFAEAARLANLPRITALNASEFEPPLLKSKSADVRMKATAWYKQFTGEAWTGDMNICGSL